MLISRRNIRSTQKKETLQVQLLYTMICLFQRRHYQSRRVMSSIDTQFRRELMEQTCHLFTHIQIVCIIQDISLCLSRQSSLILPTYCFSTSLSTYFYLLQYIVCSFLFFLSKKYFISVIKKFIFEQIFLFVIYLITDRFSLFTVVNEAFANEYKRLIQERLLFEIILCRKG